MSEPNEFQDLPRKMLRYFSNDDGRVYCCRRLTGDLFSVDVPDDVADEPYDPLPATGDGYPEHANFEELSTSLRVSVEPVIKRIVDSVRAERQPHLTSDEKLAWDRFYWHHILRSMYARAMKVSVETLRASSEVLDRKLDWSLLDDESATVNWFEGISLSGVHDQTHKESVELKRRLFAWTRDHGLVFWVLDNPKKSFVLGDVPVVEVTLPASKIDSDQRFVLFPIAFDVAVASYGPPDVETIAWVPADNKGTRFSRQTNTEIFAQSSMVAAPSRQLLESLYRRSK